MNERQLELFVNSTKRHDPGFRFRNQIKQLKKLRAEYLRMGKDEAVIKCDNAIEELRAELRAILDTPNNA